MRAGDGAGRRADGARAHRGLCRVLQHRDHLVPGQVRGPCAGGNGLPFSQLLRSPRPGSSCFIFGPWHQLKNMFKVCLGCPPWLPGGAGGVAAPTQPTPARELTAVSVALDPAADCHGADVDFHRVDAGLGARVEESRALHHLRHLPIPGLHVVLPLRHPLCPVRLSPVAPPPYR
jgi:hypothetical protein